MRNELLAVIEQAGGRAVPFHEVMREAGVPTKKNKDAKRALKALVRLGKVEREKGRRYRISRAGQEFDGTVELDGRGQPRVRLDGFVEDRALPVAVSDVDRVGDGDRVRVRLEVQGRQGQHYACVVSVEQMRSTSYVGVIQTAGGARFVEIDRAEEGDRRRHGGRPRAG